MREAAEFSRSPRSSHRAQPVIEVAAAVAMIVATVECVAR
jgi:hypothetical protein